MPASGHTSSRRRTRDTGSFVRETPGSRSLERGLSIIRAFRPGRPLLTNAEIAERTGLPRPTVSRLTRSLVDAGFLEYDVPAAAYRLGAPFLGFGQTVRQGSTVLAAALPLMREIAEGLYINVGLAVADAGDMIYLDSVRKSRLGLFRHVVSGSRVPLAETALGRAWLAGIGAEARDQVLQRLAAAYGARWERLAAGVRASIEQVETRGYCSVAWQVGMVSIAAPLAVPGQQVHAFNISFTAADDLRRELELRYAPLLLRTRDRLQQALGASAGVPTGAHLTPVGNRLTSP